MLKTLDTHLWDKIKESVVALKSGRHHAQFPPRLHVVKRAPSPLSISLDLHQMTVEEAHQQTKSFIENHFQLGTKKVLVITGKGRDKKGLIHSEFMGWLDTRCFQQYISNATWTKDEGAVEIWLKKNK